MKHQWSITDKDDIRWEHRQLSVIIQSDTKISTHLKISTQVIGRSLGKACKNIHVEN